MAESTSIVSRQSKKKNFRDFAEFATMRSRKAAASSGFSRRSDNLTPPRRQYKDREHPAELYTIDENPELISETSPVLILEREGTESAAQPNPLPAQQINETARTRGGEGETPESLPPKNPNQESCSNFLIVKLQDSMDNVNSDSQDSFTPVVVSRSADTSLDAIIDVPKSSEDSLDTVSSTYVLHLERSLKNTKRELEQLVNAESLASIQSNNPPNKELESALKFLADEPDDNLESKPKWEDKGSS